SGNAEAVVYDFLTVAGSSLLRRRDTHPQRRLHLAAEFRRGGKHDDDLAGPAITSITKRAADRAVIDPVQDKATLVVCEPYDKFAFLVLADADFLFADSFNLELLRV